MRGSGVTSSLTQSVPVAGPAEPGQPDRLVRVHRAGGVGQQPDARPARSRGCRPPRARSRSTRRSATVTISAPLASTAVAHDRRAPRTCRCRPAAGCDSRGPGHDERVLAIACRIHVVTPSPRGHYPDRVLRVAGPLPASQPATAGSPVMSSHRTCGRAAYTLRVTGTALADPLPGTVLDRRYRVDAPIARGGMSTVYAGTDLRLDRQVAVKVMAPALAHDPAFTERFVREARTAARLSHPNAVAVFDQGAEDTRGRPGRVPGDGAGARQHAAGGAAPARPAAPGRGGLGARAGAGRAGRRAPGRAGAPRRQAGERAGLRRRHGQGGGLRAGPGGRRAEHVHAGRDGARHGRVRLARAGRPRRRGRRAPTSTRPASCCSSCSPAARRTGATRRSRSPTGTCTTTCRPPSTRVAGIPPALDELVLRATRREPGGRPAGRRRVPGRAGHGPHRPRAAPGAVPATVARARLPGSEAPTVAGRAGGGAPGPTAPAPAGPRGATGARPAYARAVHRRAGLRGPSGAGASPGSAPADGSGWPAERRRRRAPGAGSRSRVVLLAALSVGDGGLVVRQRPVRGGAVADRADPGPGRSARLDGVDLTATVRPGAERDGRRRPGGPVRPGAGRPGAARPLGDRGAVLRPAGRPGPVGHRPAGRRRAGRDPAGRAAAASSSSSPATTSRRARSSPQTPAGGTAQRGSTVRAGGLHRARGSSQVPDVRGLSVDDARQKLADAGFRVKVRSLRIGNVIAQSPRGGQRARAGQHGDHLRAVTC